jgi:hypothetical protein
MSIFSAIMGKIFHPADAAQDHVRQRGVKWLVVEVTIGQAALGGICAGSASAVGAASSAMPSSCM